MQDCRPLVHYPFSFGEIFSQFWKHENIQTVVYVCDSANIQSQSENVKEICRGRRKEKVVIII